MAARNVRSLVLQRRGKRRGSRWRRGGKLHEQFDGNVHIVVEQTRLFGVACKETTASLLALALLGPLLPLIRFFFRVATAAATSGEACVGRKLGHVVHAGARRKSDDRRHDDGFF